MTNRKKFFLFLDYDLDFETVPVYRITVTCYDPIHRFTISKNFSINITDINEAPIQLKLIPNTVYKIFHFQSKIFSFLVSRKFYDRIYYRSIPYG